MANCCNGEKNSKNSTINNLKSSIFCGAKGFLTFNLALLSYAEYSLCDYMLSKSNNQEDNRLKIKIALADGRAAEVEVREKKYNPYKFLKEGAAFAMKRNTIPFIEMLTIIPFVCFALPIMIPGINLLQCGLLCAALMVATCFVIRSFNLRERLLEKQTGYTREKIDMEFAKDSIIYPIFDENNKRIKYNSPDQGQLLKDTNNTSYLIAFLVFPLKVLQSCILMSLAIVELLEAVPNLFVDVLSDRSFKATQGSLQRLCHSLYAMFRNVIPITIFDEPVSRLDESVAKLIGNPKASCCST